MRTITATKEDYELADMILKNMPQKKKELLESQLTRNNWLTSVRGFEHVNLYPTKNGYIIKMDGLRCAFNIFVTKEMEYKRTPNHEIKTATCEIELRELTIDYALDKYAA